MVAFGSGYRLGFTYGRIGIYVGIRIGIGFVYSCIYINIAFAVLVGCIAVSATAYCSVLQVGARARSEDDTAFTLS